MKVLMEIEGAMELTFVRHGEAESFAASDDARGLTEKGRTQVSNVAKHLKKSGETFDCILSSPIKRAKETAEIFAEVFEVGPKWTSDPRLSPGSDLSQIQEIVKEIPDTNHFLFVGHAPDFGNIGADLLGLAQTLDLKKGGFLKVTASLIRPGSAKLVFFGAPGLFS